MDKKTKGLVFFLVIAGIIAVIILINYAKSNGNHDDKTMKCIAENSKLFISKTCGHCAAQKEILKDYIDYFEIIDCTTNYQECELNNILVVPTWIVNGQKYSGKRTVEQLKELTNC